MIKAKVPYLAKPAAAASGRRGVHRADLEIFEGDPPHELRSLCTGLERCRGHSRLEMIHKTE